MSNLRRREFLMQAHKYIADKCNVGGYYESEKLDGTRCFWDGGITRGLSTEKCPWSNILNPKTGERKTNIKPFSTGLWSRYGNPIIAPDWWLNQLPCMPLDGELWAGRGQFQFCRSVCAKFVPINEEWEKIDFAIYGSPPFAAIFMDGRINCPQFRREISLDVVSRWLDKLPDSLLQDFKFLPKGTCFEHELLILQESVPLEGQIYLLKQRKLPFLGAAEIVERDLESVIDNGGEGLVLRDPQSCWEPQRSHQLLKYKPFSDAEGIITGFTSGQETERGSKHLGKIGALIVDYGGVRLKLSGLTGEEREFADNKMAKYAKENPGKDMPANTVGKHFKVGQVVTFKYRELSKDQVPKDARYFRPFQPE